MPLPCGRQCTRLADEGEQSPNIGQCLKTLYHLSADLSETPQRDVKASSWVSHKQEAPFLPPISAKTRFGYRPTDGDEDARGPERERPIFSARTIRGVLTGHVSH